MLYLATGVPLVDFICEDDLSVRPSKVKFDFCARNDYKLDYKFIQEQQQCPYLNSGVLNVATCLKDYLSVPMKRWILAAPAVSLHTLNG
jgi:hypothetical protein